MIIDIKDSKGKPTEKKNRNFCNRLYSKEVGDGTGVKRIATFAYKNRTSPVTTTMFKNHIY